MGFVWSKPRGTLDDSLITEYPVLVRVGDLLLVPTTDMDIALNDRLWKHVGVVAAPGKVFCDGEFTDVRVFLASHASVVVRQLHCARPFGFEQRFLVAACDSLTHSMNAEPEHRTACEVGYVLAAMGFIDWAHVPTLKAYHFSAETPFRRLDLHMYSKHFFL